MLAAGAEIVNDVYAGQEDPAMLGVIADTHAAAVLMHMRGESDTKQEQAAFDSDVATAVGVELAGTIDEALRRGVCRWALIGDPGIGSTKGTLQSAQLVGGCARMKAVLGGMPILLGASRKAWLTARKGAADWATAGAMGAAIGRGGVDVVRVHTVEVGDAVRAADKVVRAG